MQKRYIAEESPWFYDCALSWYRSIKGTVSEVTYADYFHLINYLDRYFEMCTIRGLTKKVLQTYFRSLAENNVSYSQASKCRSILIRILDHACECGYIEKNPARDVKVYQHKPRRKNPKSKESRENTYSEDDVKRLMNELPDTLMGNSILTLLGSGIQVQELLALTPNDIEADGSVIYVKRAILRVNGSPRMGVPNGPVAIRAVPVEKEMQVYAQRLRQFGLPYMNRVIWRSRRESEVYDVGVFRNQYYRELEKIEGFRALPPKACRATYIRTLELRKELTNQEIALRVGNLRLT